MLNGHLKNWELARKIIIASFDWCLFVCEVEKKNGREGREQENHVEPTVIKVELQFAEHLCDDYPIFGWHVHPD